MWWLDVNDLIIDFNRFRNHRKQNGKLELKLWKMHWTRRLKSQGVFVKWLKCAKKIPRTTKESRIIMIIMYVSVNVDSLTLSFAHCKFFAYWICSIFHKNFRLSIIWPETFCKNNTMENRKLPIWYPHWTEWWKDKVHWPNFCTTKNCWNKRPHQITIDKSITFFFL